MTNICISHTYSIYVGDNEILPIALRFITSQGRMKFVRPIYRDLFKSNLYKSIAMKTFLENSDFYHPIARKMIACDMSLNGDDEITDLKRGKLAFSFTAVHQKVIIAGAAALVTFIIMRRKK